MRTTYLTTSLIALSSAIVSSTCLAAPKADVAADIKKALETRYPQVKVVDVKPAPVAGLYEIFTGDAIVYASANGDFLVGGPMIETTSKRNVTAERLDERNSIDFSALPLDLAIKTVKGDGSRTLAVFADPDCPFCKQLEESLASIDNATIYTFLLPLTSLHPDSAAKAHAIWCASDRSQAWTQWMVEGKAATANDNCKDDPIDELQEVAQKLRVASTPVLFFPNGQRVGGTLSAEQINRKFEAIESSAGKAGSKVSSGQKPAGSATRSAN